MLVDVFSKGITGKVAGSGARQGGDHRQQERDSVRSESADGRERRPHRHARGDDARHARTGDGSHRRADHRARWQRPTTIALCRWSRPKSKRCAGTSRCIRTCRRPRTDASRERAPRASSRPPATWAARRRRLRVRRPADARAAGLRAAARPARDGVRGRQRADQRRHAARRGRHRHRQDARLSGAGDPQPQARARLHGHEEPAGTDLLEGRADAARARSACRSARPT